MRILAPLILVALSACTQKVEATCRPPTYVKVDHDDLDLEIDSDEADGRFVNMALIHHTETEFSFDLIHVQPGGGKHARIRSRIITSPQHAKRLAAALQENIGLFEGKFGPIDPK